MCAGDTLSDLPNLTSCPSLPLTHQLRGCPSQQPPGAVLCEQGQPGDAAAVVQPGRLALGTAAVVFGVQIVLDSSTTSTAAASLDASECRGGSIYYILLLHSAFFFSISQVVFILRTLLIERPDREWLPLEFS